MYFWAFFMIFQKKEEKNQKNFQFALEILNLYDTIIYVECIDYTYIGERTIFLTEVYHGIQDF